jgi:cell division protein FtsI (penicillin-binding protein 3)
MHPFQGSLTLPEVFMHSSNIGMAKIGLAVGSQQQSEYLKRFGLLQPVAMELPEKGRPWYPSAGQWTQLSSITISYGHGISVSPLHMVRTTAGLLSDQGMPEMTFLKRAPGATVHRETIVSPMTAAWMRSMFRYNTLEGTGRKGRAQGYLVGAKTGTAHKSLGSRGYSKDKITSFIGAFPIHDPKVVLLVMLDSPKPTKETFGFATGGWTAAPVFKKIVMRAAPLLSIPPVVEEDPQWEKQFLALPITPKSEGRRT